MPPTQENPYADEDAPQGTRQSANEPRKPLGVPYYETDPSTGKPKVDPVTGEKVRWKATREPDYANQLSMEGSGGPSFIAPRYFEGEERRPASLPKDDMILLQKYMISVGLVPPTTLVGIWDKTWADAYAEILGYANSTGMSDTEALTRWGEMAAENPVQRAPLTKKLTDPADLKAVFRRTWMETTGLGLSEPELDEMVATYQAKESGYDQQAYEMEGTGGSVVVPPTPASFAEQQARETDPENAVAHTALSYQEKFFDMLGGVV